MIHSGKDKIQALLRRFGIKAMVAVLFAVLSLSASAQTRVSTYGTEFWAVFMPNPNPGSPDSLVDCSIYVASATGRPCSVTVENPILGYSMTRSIQGSRSSVITIPNSWVYLRNPSINAQNKGVRIYATDTIIVWSTNFGYYSLDATTLLPTPILADEYVVQTYPPPVFHGSNYRSSIAIVATENNTTVRVTPSVSIFADTTRQAGTALTFSMSKGQSVYLRSVGANAAGDLSGTLVKSLNCKKIAVFTGNEKTVIPDTVAADHIYEQAYPSYYAGKKFVATNTYIDRQTSSKIEIVRIIALYDNTKLYRDGVLLHTFPRKGNTYQDTLTQQQGAAYYEADNPVHVYQYNVGNAIQGNGLGDPSMVWLTPVEMMSDSLRYSVLNTNRLTNVPTSPNYGKRLTGHFINIVVHTSDTSNIVCGGGVRLNAWNVVQGEPSLCYGVFMLNPNDSSVFILAGARSSAFLYGIGGAISYSYSLGAALRPVDMAVDSVRVRDANVQHYFNTGCSIEFASEVQYTHDSVLWNFGDGSRILKGDTVNYAYRRADTSFVVTMSVYSSNGCDIFVDTMMFSPIYTDTLRDTIHHNMCAGASFDTNGYMGYLPVSGRNYQPYYNEGVYTQYLVDTSSGCLHNLVIDLTVNDTLRDTIYDTICTSGRTTINNNVYTAAGIYRQKLKTPEGCDSILAIVITMADTIRSTISQTICAGSSYVVNGQTYTLPGRYRQHLHTASGCDSILHIYITVGDTLRGIIYDTICTSGRITINDSVYTAAGTYRQKLKTPQGCDSILTVVITVADTIRSSINQTICAGSSYVVNGQTYTLPGNYRQHLHTASGCDSILHINLFVLDTLRDTVRRTICAGGRFDTLGHSYRQRGVHKYQYRGQDGCFHNLVIEISVNDTLRDTVYRTLLAGTSFDTNNVSYRNAGVYTQYLRNPDSCLHNLVINISVLDTLRDTIRPVICAGQLFDTNRSQGYGPYTAAGVYTQRLRKADSSCYNLIIILTVNDTFRTRRNDTVCRGNAFTYNGLLNYLSADPSLQDTVITYRHSSVKGCDSTVLISLHINDTIRTHRYDTICAGGVFRYEGVAHTLTEDFVFRHQNIKGCDSNVVVHLYVKDTFHHKRYDSVCAGHAFVYADTAFYTTGPHLYVHTAHNGCDSNVVVNLWVKDTFRTTRFDTICRGDTFTYNGLMNFCPADPLLYDTVITYLHQTVRNCDSNVVIHLHINDTFRTERYDTICTGKVFRYQGVNHTVTEDFVFHHQTISGCDSNVVVHLFVKDTFADTIHRIICDGDRFDTLGQSYTHTRLYRHSYFTPDSCLNNLVIELNVLDTTHIHIDSTMCAGSVFRYGDSLYYLQGAYYQVVHNSNNCDLVFINLTITDTLRDTIHPVICAGSRFDTNGHAGCSPVSGQNYGPYYRQGVYTQYLRTPDSCFYNLVIDLTVNDTLRDTIHPVICAGARFDTNGHAGCSPVSGQNYGPYYRQGVYTQYLRASDSCYHNLVIDLTVNDTLRDTIHPVICAGGSFDTNGHLGCTPVSGQNYAPYTTQGVYTQYLRSADSCYHNLVIDLTVHDTFLVPLHPRICIGDTFYNNGKPYYTTGFYTDSLSTVHGCDSVITIDLVVFDTVRDTVYRTLCAGTTYDTFGYRFYLDSVYHLEVPDTSPCGKHYLTIYLTVVDTLRDTIWATICAGAAFDTNGHLGCSPISGQNYPPYYLPGEYKQYLRSPAGCFQNLVIYLSVLDTLRDTIHPVICAGFPFDTNGHAGCSPVSGRNYPPYFLPGVYTQYLRSPEGCFHNLVIDLSVNDTIRDTIDRMVCAGVSFDTNGQSYFHAGQYIQHLRQPDSCFNNLVINISVRDTLRDTIHATLCAGAPFDTNGHLGCTPVSGVNYPPYFLPGVYTQYLRSPEGCYFNLVIDLAVRDTLRDTIYRTVCAGVSFDTNGQRYYQPGQYIQHLRQPDSCYNNLVINISVRDTLRDTIYRTVCAGVSFDTNGQRYYLPGQYTQHLRQPDSCFNNLVINISVLDTVRDTIYRTVCAGASFDTNGQQYYLPGTYTQHLRQPDSCYNNLVIFLHVLDTIRDTIYPVICAGHTFDTNNISYARRGVYTQHLRDPITRCFNNLVIILTVNDTFRDHIYDTVCAGMPTSHNGIYYYLPGTHLQHYYTVLGCDSIVAIHLYVLDTIRDTVYREVCAGASFDTNGVHYYFQGYHTQHLRDSVPGCFHNLVIHLTVRDTIRAHVYDTVCEGETYRFNSTYYTTTGVYRYMMKTAEGCDSITYLHLQVNPVAMSRIYDTCYTGIYRYADTFYTRPGVYRHLFQREGTGCDSMVLLHLWFCDSILTKVYDTICNDSTYRFGDDILTQSGVYFRVVPAHNRCDSIIELHLKVVEYPTVKIVDSGGYCRDGVATLKLITNGNTISWTSFPPDNSLSGQEHNLTIYVSPDRYTQYTVVVDSVPRVRTCQATASVSLQKASPVKAAFKRDPKVTDMGDMQTTFTDISIGNVVYREWLIHETSPLAADKRYEYDSIVYFTPLIESDSFRVRLAVRNDVGCTDTATDIYPIYKSELWVPNAFTPDENINTVFKVGAFNLVEYEIYIYNRAGHLVFHATDPDDSWDGTYKGNPCVPASYVYVINYKTKTHPKQPQKKVGSVLLIR